MYTTVQKFGVGNVFESSLFCSSQAAFIWSKLQNKKKNIIAI